MNLKRNKELDVLTLFTGDYTKRYYLREIAKIVNLPLKNVQTALIELENNAILKSKIEGKNKYFNLNLDNIETKYYITQAEIYKTLIFLDKNREFNIFLKELYADNCLVVFGSFAKGIQDKNSDLDILIIGEDKIDFEILVHKVHKINIKTQNILEAIDKEDIIKEIEKNHVILNNHSYYVDKFWRHYNE
jgi:predicted nucleotidyltransferase